MHLVLASESAYRRELLARLGLPFDAVAHRCDETAARAGAPDELVRELARAKAESLAGAYPDAWILGSDQVADLDGEVVGKPGSEAGARAQLGRLQGRAHRLVTAVALRGPDGSVREALDVHRMVMRPLDAAAIARYLAAERVDDCAGSYKIEGRGIALFEAIEGADFTAIIGLPMITVVSLLGDAGFTVP